jgi:hypothetical protein
VRCVRADRVHIGTDRPVLQAVRSHDRDLNRYLGIQLAHPEPCALRGTPQVP